MSYFDLSADARCIAEFLFQDVAGDLPATPDHLTEWMNQNPRLVGWIMKNTEEAG